jgi:SPP1 family predicted phage head-tail adaptor
MLRSEKLDRQIEIRSKVATQNGYGEVIYSDTLVATVSAQITPIGGRETYQIVQIMPEADYRIVIRWRSDVTLTQKVVFGGVTYDIGHIAELGRRQGLELLVKLP